MNKATLLNLIADDEMGLLDIPVLTHEQQEIVDAFTSFILKNS